MHRLSCVFLLYTSNKNATLLDKTCEFMCVSEREEVTELCFSVILPTVLFIAVCHCSCVVFIGTGFGQDLIVHTIRLSRQYTVVNHITVIPPRPSRALV